MSIKQFSAQLAGPSKELPADVSSFVVEEKMDGMRILTVMDRDEQGNERIQLWNRYGENKGRLSNAPKFEAELREMAMLDPTLWDGTVFDGEMVADSWNATMHLLGSAGQVEGGLRYIVFDLPYMAGEDLRPQPFEYRRMRLEDYIGDENPGIMQLSIFLPKTWDKIDEIWASGGEGVIVKDLKAPYMSGDRKAWRKIKATFEGDGVITGFTKGSGKYSDTFGAVIIGQQMPDGEMREVSQMSGMTDAVRRGFDPTTDIGKVIEFKHFGKTVELRYRHPQFLRFRPDKQANDCLWENTDG